MDTILFDKQAYKSEGKIKPLKWIYTSLNGQISSKDLADNEIDEVILALLLNLNKDDFQGQKVITQDDLVSLFGKKMIDVQTGQNCSQNICFALR
jgi:hypothetical protein